MRAIRSKLHAHEAPFRARAAPHAGSTPMIIKASIAALVLLALPTFAAAQLSVAVHYDDGDVAAKTCAEEIENNKSFAGSLEPAIRFDHDLSGKSEARLHITLSGGSHYDAIGIIKAPFAFQSVKHFGAFLNSELYRELRLWDRDQWTAVGYGGAYQLFSKAHAFTEPAHFYSQYIDGAPYVLLYTRFKSKLSPSQIIAAKIGIFGDVRGMEAGDLFVDAIEAPVIDAFENGLDKAARFVNQTFSSIRPVFFQLKGIIRVGLVWTRWSTDVNLKQILTKWMEAAATACSARNFAIEQTTMQRLKDAGLQIVPVNRAALAKAGWAYSLTNVSRSWTVSDFDRLVRLAEGNVPMPSAMVNSLSPKEGKAVVEIEKRIADSRK